MFDAFCPNHGARVLLFSDNIEALINRTGGVDLHWRCPCGGVGVTHIHRSATHPSPKFEGGI